MKIKGKRFDEPNEEIVVLPRTSGDVVFKARSVLDFEPFEKICPAPKPPTVLRPGQGATVNLDDKKFKKDVARYAELRTSWMILKSLEATSDLEWETVDVQNPATWENYLKELREAKFNESEITRIIQAVLSANSLDDRKIQEARERFLAGVREAQQESASQKEENLTIQSGELAKD